MGRRVKCNVLRSEGDLTRGSVFLVLHKVLMALCEMTCPIASTLSNLQMILGDLMQFCELMAGMILGFVLGE